MPDDKMVTKEIFLKGCKFFLKEDYKSYISKPSKDQNDSVPAVLANTDGSHFANVSKVDKSGFNMYSYIFGKRFQARVLFSKLVLLERKEATNA